MDKIIPLEQAAVTANEATGLAKFEDYLAALAALIEGGRLKVDVAGITLDKDAVQALAADQFYTGQVNSGDSALATTDDNAVEAIAAQTGKTIRRIRWTNTGSVAGWLLAGATRIARLDAEGTDQVDKLSIAAGTAINIQRDSGGSDLSGVWIVADYTED